MARVLMGTLILSALLCSAVPYAECEAGKRVSAPHIWWAPDSSWAVMGFGKLRPGLAEEVMRKKPADLVGLKIYEMEVNEPAVYLGFEVALKKVEKVVFTKSTKVVIADKAGKLVESEGIFFCPDFLQTSVYDPGKWPVVVSRRSVWCHPENGCPCGWAKFPLGSAELKDIAGFEVVGAVVQGGGGEPK